MKKPKSIFMKKIIVLFLFLSIIPCLIFGFSGGDIELPKKIGVNFQSINKEYESNKPYDKVLEIISNIQINNLREAFGKIKPSGYYHEESKSFYSSFGEKIMPILPKRYNEDDTIRIIGFTRPADYLQKTMDIQLIRKDENTTIIRLVNSNTDISRGDFQKANLDVSQLTTFKSKKVNYSPSNIILQSGQPEHAEWEERAIKNFEKIIFKYIK